MKKITVFKRDYVTELVKIIRNAKNAPVHYDRYPTACRDFLLSG